MSRSGYTDDGENYGLWRGAVDAAIRGSRGQAFLRELLIALDDMPTKSLVSGDLVRDSGEVCALGALAVRRHLDVSDVDPTDGDWVGKTFGIAIALACEVVYANDEENERATPEERWIEMRKWVLARIVSTEEEIATPETP